MRVSSNSRRTARPPLVVSPDFCYMAMGNDSPNAIDVLGLLEWRATVEIGYNPEAWSADLHYMYDPKMRKRVSKSSHEHFSHAAQFFSPSDYCNTQTYILIEARDTCCKRYKMICEFQYAASARGRNYARIKYVFSMGGWVVQTDVNSASSWAQARMPYPGGSPSSGTYFLADVKVDRNWVEVSRLFPIITLQGPSVARPNAQFNEVGSVSCRALYIGPCEP